MTDVKDPLAALVTDKDWKSKVADVASKVLPKLDQLQKFFEDRCYGVGYLTWADFVISEYSYYVENVIP
jgi:hemolysin-activating ACP:hemolysin acyltransferase